MQEKIPHIVVISYNRTDALKRLLRSLNEAQYDHPVKLYISVDGGGAPSTLSTSQAFEWSHGEKEVIAHKENLGLKAHVLTCGDLTERGHPIIMLEDDLVVSHNFYATSLAMVSAIAKDDIAQISLYSPTLNEFAKNDQFLTLDDPHPAYLMKTASSWGQIWTPQMWTNFKKWLNDATEDQLKLSHADLPDAVNKWPKSSWKKEFNAFLVAKNNFVLYPRKSYTTNLGNLGTNHKNETNPYHVPLAAETIPVFEFTGLRKYDQYMELIPTSEEVQQLGLEEGTEVRLDTFGIQKVNQFDSLYFLSTRGSKQALKSFDASLLPYFLNVKLNRQGTGIVLSRGKDLHPAPKYNQDILDRIKTYPIVYILRALCEKVWFKLRKAL